MKATQAQFDLNTIAAKHENDITRILRPWYSFRVFFKFKKANHNRRNGTRQDTIHRYGFENSVSYKQCLHGHADKIILDKQHGWDHVIHMIETQFFNTYSKAIIYTRSVLPDGKFDITLREYNSKGQVVKSDDQTIMDLTKPEQNITLYYLVKDGGLLELHTEPVPAPDDFRKMVQQSVK